MQTPTVGILDGKEVELTEQFLKDTDKQSLARVICKTSSGTEFYPFRREFREVEMLGLVSREHVKPRPFTRR